MENAALTVDVEEVADIQISGKKFGAIRRKLVMTQQEFAQAIKMSLSNVRRIERSEVTAIGAKYIRALAVLEGKTPQEMLAFLRPGPHDTLPDSLLGADYVAGPNGAVTKVDSLLANLRSSPMNATVATIEAMDDADLDWLLDLITAEKSRRAAAAKQGPAFNPSGFAPTDAPPAEPLHRVKRRATK